MPVMRWGLLSLVLWAILRVLRISPRARRLAIGLALTASAAMFATGHLPATLMMGEITPALLVRTISLNFALGLVFGLAFVRHHLEAAFALHAGFHLRRRHRRCGARRIAASHHTRLGFDCRPETPYVLREGRAARPDFARLVEGESKC